MKKINLDATYKPKRIPKKVAENFNLEKILPFPEEYTNIVLKSHRFIGFNISKVFAGFFYPGNHKSRLTENLKRTKHYKVHFQYVYAKSNKTEYPLPNAVMITARQARRIMAAVLAAEIEKSTEPKAGSQHWTGVSGKPRRVVTYAKI